MTKRSLFPPLPIKDTLLIAQAIWEHNAGNPMRRVTLFDALKRQPESSKSRSLITASYGYGLTEGSYKSDVIQLTDRGRAIVADDSAVEKLNAVLSVDAFRLFYERYRDAVVPSQPAAVDFLKSQGIPEGSAPNCLEIALENGREVGIIQEISGRERVISIDHAREQVMKQQPSIARSQQLVGGDSSNSDAQGEPSRPPSIPPLSPVDEEQLPTLHIDIQIHIAADAKPEQIDQIFASMAKHLYGRRT